MVYVSGNCIWSDLAIRINIFNLRMLYTLFLFFLYRNPQFEALEALDETRSCILAC